MTLVKLYAYASMAIVLMDNSSLDAQVREALAEFACNVYKEIVYSYFGLSDSGMKGIENLIGMMGGKLMDNPS